MLFDGDAPRAIRPPALHYVGLSAGGVDADPEARQVAVPVEGIAGAGAECVDGTLGNGTMVMSRHGVPVSWFVRRFLP